MANECLFCQIIAREIPAKIRYEDTDWLAFDDISKGAPEHVLLVPKKHIATLEEVPVGERDFYADFLLTAKKIAAQLNIQNSYKLFMNVGDRVQAVKHIHLHIMGGWGKDKTREILDDEARKVINS